MKELQEKILRMSIPVTESGCWLWTGAISKNGYGNLGWQGKTLRASRAAYTAFVGEIKNDFQINHKCDVRSCVNPDHLYAGTHHQNVEDMVERGRQPRTRFHGELHPMWGKHHCQETRLKISASRTGELNFRAVINDEIAKYIYSTKGIKSANDVANELGIKVGVIYAIWAKKNWKHIHG
jgi:hypothetical protein